ncbi:MAG: glycosyltransferase family 39 protein [Bacteroidetes bacterium]|nr:glycosyltransferase family 39 protein [Bacteroidota bacterium]
MQNLVTGMITIAVCIVLYYLAWRKYKREKYTIAFILVLTGGLFLRVYTVSDCYLHEWDERYHALVAKHLVQHPLQPTLYETPVIPYDFRSWTNNHIWLEKPPVPLWLMASSLAVFGYNEIPVRIPSLILSTLAVYLTFLLGSILFNRKTGLVAAFLHSINGLLLEMAGGRISSDHVETAFVFFIELAVLLSVISIFRKKSYLITFLAGMSIGLAFLSKWFPAFIVFPVWISMVIVSKRFSIPEILKHLSLLVLGCAIITLPWLVYIFHQYPDEAGWTIRKFLFAWSETIETHSAPFWYYLNYTGIVFGELIYVPLLFSFYFIFREKSKKTDALKVLSTWWIIPMVIFSFAVTKRHTYLMIAAPAFFLIISWFIFYLRSVSVRWKYHWAGYIIAVLLIILPVRYTIERIKPFEQRDNNPEWAKELRLLPGRIPEKKVVIFNSPRPIETMFYTDFTAYDITPLKETMVEIMRKGYTIYVYDKNKLKKADLTGLFPPDPQ